MPQPQRHLRQRTENRRSPPCSTTGTTSASAPSNSNSTRRSAADHAPVRNLHRKPSSATSPGPNVRYQHLGLAAVRDAEQAKQLLLLSAHHQAAGLSDHPDDVVRTRWICCATKPEPRSSASCGSTMTGRSNRSSSFPMARSEPSLSAIRSPNSSAARATPCGSPSSAAAQQTDSLAHYADALCVPLISHRNTSAPSMPISIKAASAKPISNSPSRWPTFSWSPWFAPTSKPRWPPIISG